MQDTSHLRGVLLPNPGNEEPVDNLSFCLWMKEEAAVQQLLKDLLSMEFPLWCSGLRIWHCCSCGVGCRCSLDLIPGLETSICCWCSQRRKKKTFPEQSIHLFLTPISSQLGKVVSLTVCHLLYLMSHLPRLLPFFYCSCFPGVVIPYKVSDFASRLFFSREPRIKQVRMMANLAMGEFPYF